MVVLSWEEMMNTPVYQDAKDYSIVLPNSNFKKIRRTFFVIGLVLCVVLSGVIGYRNKLIDERNRAAAYKSALNSLYIDFGTVDGSELTEFEYGDEVNLSNLVVDYGGLLSVSSAYLDTETLGTKDYTYSTYTLDAYGNLAELNVDKSFTVVDTNAPVITFDRSEISVSKGSSFDVKSNISSVIDTVDGDLVYLEEAPVADTGDQVYLQGWYTISSDVDTSATGTYTVTVHAEDIHGLVTEKSYTVKVYQPYSRVYISSGTALSNYNTIVSTIMSWGYNRAAAVGIAANAKQESGFNPGAYNSAGYYGLFQWGGNRWSNLVSYCNSNGYSSDSLAGQLAFMKYELSSYGNLINILKNVPDSAEGAATAATSFRSIYERGWMGPVANTARSLYNDY